MGLPEKGWLEKDSLLVRMLKALLSACLLLALLSPALPLKCRFNFNKAGLTYNGYAKTTCESFQDSCEASVLHTNINKREVQIENTCLSSRYCFSGDYSFTAADGKFFEMKMQCCNTDLCNNETLSLPDRNMLAENGLQCPSCFSKGEKKCKSEKTINCLENETQCVDFKGALFQGFIQHRRFTFQGCATTNFCAIQKNGRGFIATKRILLLVYKESCYNASRISHQPEQEG
ncbi:phospholipase A2 inhibitor and Ly6/PLAUR domain-containing protein-like [Podarcis raffonei]|uniref:phospholipase A2 inhibitor and Ly6/PLAUR domain-containing protein-like n=1 Tax=Podarcis raffonei TaxID=65483 RepID=UPI0023292839|nr:phospholipase A2 inhibitor and Ly6/PLAUR domain-containing protein-like [Podarcis raffonei]